MLVGNLFSLSHAEPVGKVNSARKDRENWVQCANISKESRFLLIIISCMTWWILYSNKITKEALQIFNHTNEEHVIEINTLTIFAVFYTRYAFKKLSLIQFFCNLIPSHWFTILSYLIKYMYLKLHNLNTLIFSQIASLPCFWSSSNINRASGWKQKSRSTVL